MDDKGEIHKETFSRPSQVIRSKGKMIIDPASEWDHEQCPLRLRQYFQKVLTLGWTYEEVTLR